MLMMYSGTDFGLSERKFILAIFQATTGWQDVLLTQGGAIGAILVALLLGAGVVIWYLLTTLTPKLLERIDSEIELNKDTRKAVVQLAELPEQVGLLNANVTRLGERMEMLTKTACDPQRCRFVEEALHQPVPGAPSAEDLVDRLITEVRTR